MGILDVLISEHCKTPGQDITAVGEHTINNKHNILLDNVKIIAQEEQNVEKEIRESLLSTSCCHVISHVINWKRWSCDWRDESQVTDKETEMKRYQFNQFRIQIVY